MAIHIDDAVVLRMVNARIEAAVSAAATRMLGEEVDDSANVMDVVLGLDLSPRQRTSTDDQDLADLALTLECSVGQGQSSDLAIGELATELRAALSEQNLVDGVTLGGSVDEHLVSLGRVWREFRTAVTADARRVPTAMLTVAGTVVRRSGTTFETHIS